MFKFKTISAALVATSLIAGPVLAQGTSTAPTIAPAAAAKTDATKPAVTQVKKAKRHSAKFIKHRKLATHAKQVMRHVAKNDSAKNLRAN
jgi:hypothetical protein